MNILVDALAGTGIGRLAEKDVFILAEIFEVFKGRFADIQEVSAQIVFEDLIELQFIVE